MVSPKQQTWPQDGARHRGVKQMIASGFQKWQQQIAEHNAFSEWILLDVLWQDQGTTLVVVLQNPHVDAASSGVNPSEVPVVHITFSSVQEFSVQNALTHSMLQRMSEINWGLSEISRIQIGDVELFTSRYSDLPEKFYHAAFLWEGQRRIDLVFRQMTIEPRSA